MHNQVLVIYPYGVDLDDVMYPYQEIDKLPADTMNDERCEWRLTVPEKEIPLLLDKIEEDIKKDIDIYLEVLTYRSKHTQEECKEKYGFMATNTLNNYIYFCDKLNEFNKIKDLPFDDYRQIGFLTSYAGYVLDEGADIYIKGEGYGFFYNPYQIWDFYNIVDKRRFPKGTNFLISNYEEEGYNNLLLDVLNIPLTLKNIYELTRVWEYIIFCEKDPSDSRLYTIDTIRFSDEWNKHCLVDDLETVLKDIQEKYKNKDYMVTAVDFHW